MNDVKLLPCPFCGHAEPYFERLGTPRQSCIVVCGNCGCRHESSDEGSDSGRQWNTRADATCALRGAQIPDGWILVPFKPTEDMCRAAVVFANGSAVYKNLPAAVLEIEEGIYREAFEAMLAAAPKPNSYGCTCQSGKCPHASSCAVHNAPAYLPGPCDCGVISPPTPEGEAK